MKVIQDRMLTQTFTGAGWELRNGDCIEELGTLASDSIDLSVYSPPFMSLYTYTASEHDLGNCATDEEFFAHFAFLQQELLRVTKPGRLTCCHVAQVPPCSAKTATSA